MQRDANRKAKGPPKAGLSFGRYPHVASRVFDRPLLIEQTKLNAILRVLSGRMGFGVSGETLRPAMMDDEYGEPGPTAQEMRAARLSSLLQVEVEPQPEGHFIAGSTAIVPVLGTLVQRSSWMDAMSGLASYESIGEMFDAALTDARAQEILFEYDTPGGEVAGAFDLAERIFQARTVKPITSYAAELAASAGYLLASAGGQIVMPRTGSVGSIGVVVAHVDYSAALEQDGIAVTFVYAGDKKVDANPYEPLSDRARGDLQGEIDTLYQLFADTVARNRGLTSDQVRGTKAGMFLGTAAVDAGLVDGIDTFDNEVTRSITRPGARSRLSTSKESVMKPETPNQPGAQTITAEQVSAARTEGHAQGVAEGAATGAKAERGRIKAIVMHADAEGRTQLAHHLAFETDMAADAAAAMLGKTPKAAADTKGGLAAAMAALGTPGATNPPGNTTTSGEQQPVIDASSIFERRRQASAK